MCTDSDRTLCATTVASPRQSCSFVGMTDAKLIRQADKLQALGDPEARAQLADVLDELRRRGRQASRPVHLRRGWA